MRSKYVCAVIVKHFLGLFVYAGQLRRVQFEASDASEASELARAMNVGLQGEAHPDVKQVEPEVYDLATTQRMLGNVCRTTLWRWEMQGRLVRVPHTRKVLFSRDSVERCARTSTAGRKPRNAPAADARKCA